MADVEFRETDSDDNDDKATIEQLVFSYTEMERGMKMMIDLIAQHDKRLRDLELEIRKQRGNLIRVK